MKLLLILAAILGLVVSQDYALRERSYRMAQPESYGDTNNLMRIEAVDAVFSKIQDLLNNDMQSAYDQLKDILNKNGLTAVSKLADDVVDSLNQFADKIKNTQTNIR